MSILWKQDTNAMVCADGNVFQYATHDEHIKWAADIKNNTLEERTYQLEMKKIKEQFSMLSLVGHSNKPEKLAPTLRELLAQAKTMNEQSEVYGEESDEEDEGEGIEENKAAEGEIGNQVQDAQEEKWVNISLSSDEESGDEEEREWNIVKYEDAVEEWSFLDHDDAVSEGGESNIA